MLAGSYRSAGTGGLLAHPETTSSKSKLVMDFGAMACPMQWTVTRMIDLCGSPIIEINSRFAPDMDFQSGDWISLEVRSGECAMAELTLPEI